MTMVPAENYLPKQHHQHLPHGGGFYGYCGSSYSESFGLMSRVHGYDFHTEIGSDLVASNRMAEDESRTNSLSEAAASNSKDNNNNQEQEQDEGWLQLSIGAQAQATRHEHERNELDPTARTGGLIELDLLSGGSSHSQQASRPLGLGAPMFHMPEFPFRPPQPQQRPQLMHGSSTPLFFQQYQQGSGIGSFPHYGELSSSFKPITHNMAAPPSASSSSASYFVPMGSYFARPFPVQPEMDIAGPSSEFRIIDPPRRPHSGIWFVLQASQNQAKEPFLPQIPKSYLRIKDGKMKVRLLMKYVANKLGLDSESEDYRTWLVLMT